MEDKPVYSNCIERKPIDTLDLYASCAQVNVPLAGVDEPSNISMSSVQVSFSSHSIADDEKNTSPSQNKNEEVAVSTNETSSNDMCKSSSLCTTSKIAVEDENEIRRQPSDNSLLDEAEKEEEDDNDDDDDDDNTSTVIPPPPPPQPPQSQQKREQNQPSKLKIQPNIKPIRRLNRVSLHIYDLISSDTLMQLPWGCVCEIGKCFNEVNSALHELGTGAYHVGIECNGIEYAYGACSQPNKTGVFSCIPKLSPGYQYRTSIDFGYIPLIRSSWIILPPTNSSSCNESSFNSGSSPRSVTSTGSSSAFHYQEEFIDGRLVIKEMAAEYMGSEYDILKRNCCTFAADACVRLGVPEEDVPTWFRNLAETGAYSHTNFVEPLQHVLSGVGQPNNSSSTSSANNEECYGSKSQSKRYSNYNQENENNCSTLAHHQKRLHAQQENSSNRDDDEPGFEVIARRNASNTRDVVVVIDATTTITKNNKTFSTTPNTHQYYHYTTTASCRPHRSSSSYYRKSATMA